MFEEGDRVHIKKIIYETDYYFNKWLKTSKNDINFIWTISCTATQFEKDDWYIIEDDTGMLYSAKIDWLDWITETNIEDWG